MLEAIGKELKITRIRNNLKSEQVAEDFEINKETLRRYEKNSSGLSVERLEQLLDYYEVDKNLFFENVCAYLHKHDKSDLIQELDNYKESGN